MDRAKTTFALLTRRHCHLCDEMKAVLDAGRAPLGFEYELIDVDSDPELVQRFGETVPVLLREGKVVAKVRLDSRQLKRIARRRR